MGFLPFFLGPLGAVELAPLRRPASLGVRDSVDEVRDEDRLDVEQGEAVVLLHEEQRMDPAASVWSTRVRVSARCSSTRRARSLSSARASSGGSAAINESAATKCEYSWRGSAMSSRNQSRISWRPTSVMA